MSFNYSPRVVTDGLLIYSDIANPKSFVTGTTACNSLTRNQINGVTSGVTYNTLNLGILSFSGGSDINYGNDNTLKITTGSVSIWARVVQNPNSTTGGYNGIIAKTNAWGLFLSGGSLLAYDWGTQTPKHTGRFIGDNSWRNLVMSFTGATGSGFNNAIVYIDSVPVLTTSINILSQNNGFHIGFNETTNQFMSGSVSNFMLYNKVLSPQEVTQNYNATKGRFGK